MRATYKQTYDAAVAAGFSAKVAPLVVAIGVAESGLVIDAVGDTNSPSAGCHSYGVMQINVCPGRETSALFNPATLVTLDGNMRAAFERSGQGRNFAPWTTFSKGLYLPYMTGAQHVAAGGSDISAGPATTSGGGVAVAAASGGVAAESAVLGIPFTPTIPGLGWLADITGVTAEKNALVKGIAGLMLRGVFIVGGVGLFVLGAYRVVQPTIEASSEKLAPLAAAAAL